MPRKPTSLLIILATFLVIPLLALLAIRVESNTQDINTWLPSGTEQRERYDWFVGLFGHDDEIIISWDGCHTEDPRLMNFRETSTTRGVRRLFFASH